MKSKNWKRIDTEHTRHVATVITKYLIGFAEGFLMVGGVLLLGLSMQTLVNPANYSLLTNEEAAAFIARTVSTAIGSIVLVYVSFVITCVLGIFFLHDTSGWVVEGKRIPLREALADMPGFHWLKVAS